MDRNRKQFHITLSRTHISTTVAVSTTRENKHITLWATSSNWSSRLLVLACGGYSCVHLVRPQECRWCKCVCWFALLELFVNGDDHHDSTCLSQLASWPVVYIAIIDMRHVDEPYDHHDDDLANGEWQPSAADAEVALLLRAFLY